MRIALGILAAVSLMSIATTASAQVYPWCAEYGMRGGATNCGFSTLQQCEWSVSGNGGFCRRNLFYTEPPPRRSRQGKRHG